MPTGDDNIIEHIVLFKVKPETPPSEVAAMVNGLNSLASLDPVLHLTAGPIHRFRSSSPLTFTHVLHIRFRSKQDLHTYSVHPSHVRVVNESKPIIDDIMAVDWITDDQPDPDPDSAMKIMLFKLKSDGDIRNLLSLIGTMGDRFSSISFGENISPGRSKGFSAGLILNLSSACKLEEIDSEVEEKTAEVIDSIIVVNLVIPATTDGDVMPGIVSPP